MKTSAIFVELDTLLDTRMATLNRMGQEAVESALKAGYHSRPFDFFPGVDEAEFKRLYDARDKVTLAQALVTPICQLVREFVAKTLDNVHNSPFHYRPKIILNIHPYKLTEGEIQVFIKTFRALTLGAADIEAVDMSYEQISPLYVKTNLSVMVLYQYDQWLEVHSQSEAFKKVTAPDVSLLAPAIYFKKPEKKPKPDDDPFAAMQQLAAPFIGLALMPIENFSMVLKPVKKDAT